MNKNQFIDGTVQAYSEKYVQTTVKGADMFYHYSTMLGSVSFGNPAGSWFIEKWSSVMENNFDLNLRDQALLVNNMISEKSGKLKKGEMYEDARMMPCVEHSLRKKLFLQKNLRNYVDGGTYKGDFLNNKRHGKSTYSYKDGKKYVGDWVNDERSGRGITYLTDGARYEGEFLNDKAHGKGTYYDANGTVRYKGQYSNGNEHGKRTYYFASGEKYVGDFVDGRKTGKGTMCYADDNIFEGEFLNGSKHGKGILYYPNKEGYEGQFFNNTRHVVTRKLSGNCSNINIIYYSLFSVLLFLLNLNSIFQ
jgi:hypothetical protein